MRIALVAAVARNGVIGGDGALPWRISDDLKWFKKNTLGKPVIMGRKTYDSIGKALPGRDNIVLTRAPDFAARGIFIARTVRGALALGRACAKSADAEEVCVIGGGDIYAQMVSGADRIYLSRVDAEPAGDATFPALNPRDWREKKVGECGKTDKNEHACEFVILDRRGVNA